MASKVDNWSSPEKLRMRQSNVNSHEFFCARRALGTSSDDAWSRFAHEMKALYTKNPKTRFSNQGNLQKIPGTGQESWDFGHLDGFAGFLRVQGTFRRAISWLQIQNRMGSPKKISKNQIPKPGKSQESSWNCSGKLSDLDDIAGFLRAHMDMIQRFSWPVDKKQLSFHGVPYGHFEDIRKLLLQTAVWGMFST